MDESRSEVLERIRQYTVPELCDGLGEFESMDWDIKPWISRKRILGYALTVDVPAGEGGIIADAIHLVKEKDVIVIAGKGNLKSSYWGDHRSLCAKMMGAAGVVIDGAFRDLEGCEEVGLPVYAKGLTCKTAGKSGVGEIDVPVICGGITICPGDIVVGDINGVCVLRPEDIEWVLERTERKVSAQKRVVEEMERTGQVITRIKWN
ncbi:RraA family protein [Lacrimispora sp.]|uniref:RraA family protein n=1 Tax=Lacrimispora sp. TaxID=2719234 RepID=UPI002FD9BB99